MGNNYLTFSVYNRKRLFVKSILKKEMLGLYILTPTRFSELFSLLKFELDEMRISFPRQTALIGKTPSLLS